MHPTANSVAFIRKTPVPVALSARRVMPGVRHHQLERGDGKHMSIVDKDIRPISHGVIGGLIGTGLVALFVALYDPARNIAVSVLSIRVQLVWLLLTVILLGFVIGWLKKKLINLEREFKVISA